MQLTETVGRLVPTISVTPLILLRSDTGSWVRVSHNDDVYLIPYRYDEIQKHLNEINAAAEDLVDRVHRQLGRRLQPATIEEHYADGEAFEGLPAVEQIRRQSDHFRIVTGQFTHFSPCRTYSTKLSTT